MENSQEKENLSVAPQPEPNLVDMIIQIQGQLLSMEKKIDSLSNKLSEKPFDRGSGGRSNRFDRGRRDNRRGGRNFTTATCAKCGKECQVPFKPTGGRPVYCSDCFEKQSGGGSSNRKRNDRHGRGRNDFNGDGRNDFNNERKFRRPRFKNIE